MTSVFVSSLNDPYRVIANDHSKNGSVMDMLPPVLLVNLGIFSLARCRENKDMDYTYLWQKSISPLLLNSLMKPKFASVPGETKGLNVG
jgi:hypothetical protein